MSSRDKKIAIEFVAAPCVPSDVRLACLRANQKTTKEQTQSISICAKRLKYRYILVLSKRKGVSRVECQKQTKNYPSVPTMLAYLQHTHLSHLQKIITLRSQQRYMVLLVRCTTVEVALIDLQNPINLLGLRPCCK